MLIEKMYNCMQERQALIAYENNNKFNCLMKAIQLRREEFNTYSLISEKIDEDGIKLKSYENDENTVQNMCAIVPVVGFNSGRYDINLIRRIYA